MSVNKRSDTWGEAVWPDGGVRERSRSHTNLHSVTIFSINILGEFVSFYYILHKLLEFLA